MFQKILLAFDGSEAAQRAADLAGEMARTYQAALRIVIAYDPVPSYIGEPDYQRLLTGRLQHAEEMMAEAHRRVGEVPGEIKEEILEGPAAETILDVAKTRASDLIIMGARGMGRLTTLLIGSISQKVVAHADCPVLLVR